MQQLLAPDDTPVAGKVLWSRTSTGRILEHTLSALYRMKHMDEENTPINQSMIAAAKEISPNANATVRGGWLFYASEPLQDAEDVLMVDLAHIVRYIEMPVNSSAMTRSDHGTLIHGTEEAS